MKTPLLSRISQFCWLFFPPLILAISIFSLYFYYSELISGYLVNLWWMSYASLALAAIIAWQFGRSRLVYACLLLLLLTLDKQLTLPAELLDVSYGGILLSLLFLLYSRDKGFSVVNLSFSVAILTALFAFSWLALPLLQAASQVWLSSLDSILLKVWPSVRAYITPFNGVLLVLALLLGLIRLLAKIDNTHNGLFFALGLSALIYSYDDAIVTLIGIISLASLFCYSVLKDSFTMAFKDELTGIPSRRALMQYVQTLGRKYTVVMSDIDHFKKFNDTYGHDVGDEVLKLVASKLNKVMGGGKTFRFGGEEFVIVFPRKTTTEVLPFVEIVRQTIADYDIALRSKPRPAKPKKSVAKKLLTKSPVTKKSPKNKVVKVTSSFGVAHRTKEHADFSGIMKQADIALYAAKKAGRNCVKVAQQ
ncbi:GGDEF domain-containing protein [uncultured Paraglaciecola sp.]|uniref:GGDEF domain-containing protein n=1 Tax=uncultured Paraglaciecola sp. TaxID=1765024 RepID=UPI0026226E68|nr:GGDEF domain-containing protein [uncultured Paraglaciecola sp.]